MRTSRLALLTTAATIALGASVAHADDVLRITSVVVDRPTLLSIGVQALITDDDDHDASVTVRYRQVGTPDWRVALPLYRVRPEVVTGFTVPEQFAGSVLELRPATSYEVELHAVDPDGTDDTRTVTATTRAVPGDPITPRAVRVTDVSALNAVLASAAAGDVITLANGTYTGNFSIDGSGTESNPIVIRGESVDGAILDGGGCTGCNVLEVYGSYVHLEGLTIQNASRALRFQGGGATNNVVRRVHIRDVTLGIGSRDNQLDFYVCDNELEGRLTWPSVYTDDGGTHANDDGINMAGDGHVVCHNRLVGFGDAMKIEQDGARSFDAYGNEVTSAYDNALELDAMTGNGRAFRNRFTNVFAPLSFQPIYGGPMYAFRNVVINVVDEQMKLHGLGTGQEPSGIFAFHNTFVSSAHAMHVATTATTHYVTLQNNLFVGPSAPDAGRTCDWDAPRDNAFVDYDGWFPQGEFFFFASGASLRYPNFAAMVAGGIYEANGVLLTAPIFASGLTAPSSYMTALASPDVTLDGASNAIDRGAILANVNDGFMGTGPDLGALERGCAIPIYGPRPIGTDENNEPTGCEGPPVMPGVDGGVPPGTDGGVVGRVDGGGVDGGRAADGGGVVPADEGGCGCRVVAGERPSAALLGMLVIALGLLATRARRRRRL